MELTDSLRTREPSASIEGDIAVLSAPGEVTHRGYRFPAPQADEARVRLEGCGICGSNIPVWEGKPWFDYPREPGSPGHEGWGVVDAVGEDVQQFSVGDRVALLSYHAFASHDFAKASQVVPLPASITLPFPGEALGCAMNVFHRSSMARGQRVAIVGIGFLGALLVQLARAAGATVVAISRRPSSLTIAERCGADASCPLDEATQASVDHQRLEESFDCVIEATGTQSGLDVASRLVTTRGRLVIAGFHQDGLRSVDMQSWNWRGIDVINAHERDPLIYVRGIREAVTAVEEGRIQLAELLSHGYPLADLDQALRAAQQRPDGFMKAWIQCSA